MKTKIKRFDKNLPLPTYQTRGAAAFDLHTRDKVRIAPQSVGYVSLNIALKPPKNHFFLVTARSSTHKYGLMPIHGIGIGDPDFSGDQDEYKMPLFNFTKKPVIVERGDRIAQGMFVKFTRSQWQEVSTMKAKTRGGFGTTGKK